MEYMPRPPDKLHDLKCAIRSQDNEEAKKLIEKINNPNDLLECAVQDISILMFAAIYSIRPLEIIEEMIKKCPEQVTMQPSHGRLKGQTVLHLLINRGQLEAVESVLILAGKERSDFLIHAKSRGKQFWGTSMMGELPLSVAALTFNEAMVRLLYTWGAEIEEQNSKGDTVFHSLVRYARLYPEKHEKVVGMMDYLNKNLVPGMLPGVANKQAWRIENTKGLTALQLAAKLATSKSSLFDFIFNLKGVYCHFDDSDGMFNTFEFDITEVDTIADWRRRRQKLLERESSFLVNKAWHKPNKNEMSVSTHHEDAALMRFEKGSSVLELVCESNAQDAFPVLENEIVEAVVKEKWKFYLSWFVACLLLHLGLMILVTFHSVHKAESICYKILAENATTEACAAYSSVDQGTRKAKDYFVFLTSMVLVVPALAILAYELMRVYRRPPKLDLNFERNSLYRILLFILALCILGDNVWYWMAGPTNNFFLILALLVGWWFMIFFLRPFKVFSFFTVMMQKVLLGDMARFSLYVIFEFIAFSVALYILYIPAPHGPPEEFANLPETALTMFKLMLGLVDIQVLGKASIPWLATLLFVLFVLLTYALMLNSLIALMVCTCSGVAAQTEQHCKLQRLSVILYMETLFPVLKIIHAPGRPLPAIEPDRIFLQGRHVIVTDLSKENREQTLLEAFELLRSRNQQAFLRTEETEDRGALGPAESWTKTSKAFDAARDDELVHAAEESELFSAARRISVFNFTSSVEPSQKPKRRLSGEDTGSHSVDSCMVLFGASTEADNIGL
ncbi:transient receptor potential cation channel subfamily V member 3-like [Littorina saxatilis]|uniref:Ion transport domain-containing protein n=1 Tax=Littorina saxatilis TaxID=31220 RepID=A0AAN9BM76_9CAEN